ncbi:pumilio-family RNA binding repeat protein [Ichthyophthirius multifiliis]|uniref:Pumilio-family RNA binding repeat protein n=1 Tax=Ichthyophthirius multifiliis TaxID=5932 RepID=G0QJX9_ICHMU|nr:pumilio-family RNA binding repeat protein [Ichthyophthirius multifiliis]EGR34480.1 pumilio-family RNA binding repeat protein [Ichthyophthirius multifiliis]|eukprot:XP_004039784.1 pumilio-family RNA binding repeat protein [Ichthyophthirius multifiliis]
MFIQKFNNNININNNNTQYINENENFLQFNQIFNDLIFACKDQNSSRIIQKQFEVAPVQLKNAIFKKIYHETFELMKDQFGNYVIQKLFEKGLPEHKKQLFQVLIENTQDLCLHTYGCRVIQKAIEELQEFPLLQEQIIDELSNNIMDYIQDQHGNHVIQKLFECVDCSKLQVIIDDIIQNVIYLYQVLIYFIFNFMIKKIQTLAFHPYGCRVIQRILEFCQPQQTKQIYQKLKENLILLCKCQYGNYIIQYIIENGLEEDKQYLLQVVKKNFVSLSLNKFASNVTEKSILYSNDEFKYGVLENLLRLNQNNEQNI